MAAFVRGYSPVVRLLPCTVAVLLVAVPAVGLGCAADPTRQSSPGGGTPGVFTGDFETGNISQWTWGAQCANTGVPSSGSSVRGTVTVQSEIVGQGRHAARFDLPAAANAYTACETLDKRLIDLGSDDYYGLMVRFPDDWREPSPVGWGLSLAQLNFENIWGAPVMLAAHADHVALVMQSGLCKSVSTSTPGCAYSSGAEWKRRSHERGAGAARTRGLARADRARALGDRFLRDDRGLAPTARRR